jgi:hypothetical protein
VPSTSVLAVSYSFFCLSWLIDALWTAHTPHQRLRLHSRVRSWPTVRSGQIA